MCSLKLKNPGLPLHPSLTLLTFWCGFLLSTPKQFSIDSTLNHRHFTGNFTPSRLLSRKLFFSLEIIQKAVVGGTMTRMLACRVPAKWRFVGLNFQGWLSARRSEPWGEPPYPSRLVHSLAVAHPPTSSQRLPGFLPCCRC